MPEQKSPPLSPSRAKDFLQCPKLYYYKTILGIKTPPTEATLRGTIAHYAFEMTFEHDPAERVVETALAYVEPAWRAVTAPLVERSTVEPGSPEYTLRSSEGRFRDLVAAGSSEEQTLLEDATANLAIVPAERLEAFLETVRTAVRGWFAMESPAKFTPIDRERYVRAKVGKALVHGYIDRLDSIKDKSGVDRVFISDYKGLALSTPLPTPTGWTTMERVRVGDLLLGTAGSPVRVTEKTPEQKLSCYELRFSDGSRIVADEVHLWTLADGSTVSTRELAGLLELGDPVVLPTWSMLELPAVDTPMSPYAAGTEVTKGDFLHPESPAYRTLLLVARGSIAQRTALLSGAASVSPTGSILVRDAAVADLLGECSRLSGFGALSFTREPQGLLAAFRMNVAATPVALVKAASVPSVATACVAVDAENRLYLAGPGMIPTHNTGKKPSERFADEAFFQLEVYAAAMAAEGTDVYQLRLIYTNEAHPSGVLVRNVDSQVLEKTRKKLSSVWDNIRRAEKSSNWPTRKQRLCDWCFFKDVCPAFHPELDGLLPEEVEARLSLPTVRGPVRD